MSMRRTLAANQNVGAAFNHVAGAAAVFVEVAQAMGLEVVDDYGLAAGNGHPGIGAATVRVVAGIGDAQGGAVIGDHVGRAGLGRTDADVRTPGALSMVVRGHQGLIAEPALGLHCMLRNISQAATGRNTSWR